MIKLGIVGYGNLGKAVLSQIKKCEDIKLVAVFSRRDLRCENNKQIKFEKLENIKNYVGKVDVMIMCGGSANDLMIQSPEVLKSFCVVDSFDTHAKILEHFSNLNRVGTQNKTLALLSVGWDPGLFSLMRLLFESVAEEKCFETFWGKGVSQGHSDAIRRIDGVIDARQYTIPKEDAIFLARCGKVNNLTPRQKHLRECFVVIKDGEDKQRIENEIKNMPNYFSDYDTVVHFISKEEMETKHKKLAHGGMVVASFETENKNKCSMEFSLKLDSNPEFTASVMLCYARAVHKMRGEGRTGALTVFDIPFSYLINKSQEELLKSIL